MLSDFCTLVNRLMVVYPQFGAENGSRTRDLIITIDVLYQLSYLGSIALIISRSFLLWKCTVTTP